MKTLKLDRPFSPPNAAEAQEQPANAPPAAVWIFNTIVILCAILFAWSHAFAFFQMLRLSILLVLAKSAVEIQFYVRRSAAPFFNTSAYAWLIALCGAAAPLMFRPTDIAPDVTIATVMQVIGLVMLVYGVQGLGRDPEAITARQGVGSDGLYRIVRHPIFLALMLCEYGYVLNHTTFYNMCVLALVTFFQVLRVKEEERLLSDDKAFQQYARRTSWRVIPGVF